MNVLLWILQALLALVFAAVGGLKLAVPKEKLLDKMGVLAHYPPLAIKAIGLVEVLGALGVLLTPFVGWGALVPWAALGLACVVIAAAFAHGEHGEWAKIAGPAVLLVVAVVVVYGRTVLPA